MFRRGNDGKVGMNIRRTFRYSNETFFFSFERSIFIKKLYFTWLKEKYGLNYCIKYDRIKIIMNFFKEL